MQKHFATSVARYGPHVCTAATRYCACVDTPLQQCVNLAEQGGREGVVTDAYRKGAEKLGNPDVRSGSS